MSGFARALYDFPSAQVGEIPLAVGDIVQIIRRVDDNWLCGCLYDQVGNFPANFVQALEIPPVHTGEKVFAAIKNFSAEMQGDLGFQKGDIIVGTEPVDENWWRGKKGWELGIFPVTHVSELNVITTPISPAQDKPPSLPSMAPSGNIPSNSSSQRIVQAKARATMDLSAQLDEELGFCVGDIVSIFEVIDSDFAIGECNGKCGQFPLAFVQVFEGCLDTGAVKTEKRKSKFRWWEEEGTGDPAQVTCNASQCPNPADQNIPQSNHVHSNVYQTDLSNQDYNRSHHAALNGQNRDLLNVRSTHEQTNTQQFTTDSILRKKNATQPSNFQKSVSPEPFVQTHRRQGSYTSENTRSYLYDSGVTAYGKTLFPFIAENSNELTFFDNEIITLTRHIDEQWMEGEIDGKTGIFPTTYVEIIVDCPWADEIPSLNNNKPEKDIPQTDECGKEEISNGPDTFVDEVYGRVLYDFKAESSTDLDMQEGDTVTVLRKLDDNWFEARHDDGRLGLCPVSYIEVIGAEPTTPMTPGDFGSPSLSGPGNKSKASETSVSVVSEPVSGQVNGANTTPAFNTAISGQMGHPSVTDSSQTCPPEDFVPKPSMKPKPSLKPKPQLKPKPAVKPTSPVPKEDKLPTPTLEIETNGKPSRTPASSKPPLIPMRSIDGEKPPQKPAPTVRRTPSPQLQTVPSDTSLDEMILSQLELNKQDADVKSQGSGGSFEKLPKSRTARGSRPASVEETISPRVTMYSLGAVQFSRSASMDTPVEMKPECLALGQSTFFSPGEVTEDNTSVVRPRPAPGCVPSTPPCRPDPPQEIKKRPPPPRPEGPRPAPAPSKTPLLPGPPGRVDFGPKPVPQRPAPPRPSQMPTRPTARPQQPRKPGDLMDFSPENSTASPSVLDESHAEVVKDLDNRLAEIEKDLQKYQRSREELQQMLHVVKEGDGQEEVQESLQFYEDNINGLTQERQTVLGSLYELQPERAQADAEAQRRKEEHRRRLAEEHKRREEEEHHREAMVQKRKETREKVIAEIMQTEQDYLQGLNLAVETFLSPESEKCAAVDWCMLLGNIDEVIEVSQNLLSSLEGCVSGKDFGEQVVGTSFVALKDDMKKVYAPYCRNHDDVIALLGKYEENIEVQEYLSRMLDQLRKHTSVFDLGSILIKPVQRVLKYPLLLNELIKATEEEHPDKMPLHEAINAMTDVAAAINEYKRRKDLVMRYKKDTDQRLTDKISRLSMHSTRKMFHRVTQRMVGIQTIDEDFIREERKFNNLDKAVRALAKDVSLYLEQLQESVGGEESVAHNIADYYGERSTDLEVEKFCRVHVQLSTQLYTKFKGVVENQVIGPLNRLLLMFQGPAKVIKKRHDKLLDYDNAQSRVKNLSKDSDLLKNAQAELQMAKNNYAALNAQLLDELPQMYTLAVDVVRHCVGRMIQSQRSFHSQALEEMYQLLGLPLVLAAKNGNLIEDFNIAHTAAVECLSDLSFIPRTFNPLKEEKKPANKNKRSSMLGSRSSLDGEPSTQSDSQRMYLRQVYVADRLYRVVSDFSGGSLMDLALPSGTMVGIIKEGDPMGNKDRWYVDDGANKGFIPKKFLTLATPERTGAVPVVQNPPPLNVGASPVMAKAPVNLMDLASPEEEGPAKATPIPADLDFSLAAPTQVSSTSTWYQSGLVDELEEEKILEEMMNDMEDHCDPPPQYTQADTNPQPLHQSMCYRAVYSFEARSPIEVSLQEGQLITVVQKNDIDGNSEWWLVDVDGRQGYAPANYLYSVQ